MKKKYKEATVKSAILGSRSKGGGGMGSHGLYRKRKGKFSYNPFFN